MKLSLKYLLFIITIISSNVSYILSKSSSKNNSIKSTNKNSVKSLKSSDIIQENLNILKTLTTDKHYTETLTKITADPKKSQLLNKLIKENDFDLKNNDFESKRLKKVKEFWGDKKHEGVDVVAGKKFLRDIDDKGTIQILKELKEKNLIHTQTDYLLELAAGIGRISKNIFVKWFNKIDALEPSPVLADKIKELQKSESKIKNVYVKTGENFTYERKYNVIFASWLLENMTDASVIKFLIKTRENLVDNGVFILKENVSNNHINVDSDGMSQRIRTVKLYKLIFELVGLKLIINRETKQWPKSYYMLREFVLVKNK